jgi:adenylate cyclase
VAEAAPGMAFLEAGHLALKGVTERLPAYILVGGADLQQKASFRQLQASHGRLLQGLREGSDPTAALAECLAMTASVEPGLAGFYGRIAGRSADFR